MSLDFFQEAQRDATAFALRRPVEGLDPGFGASFGAAWQDSLRRTRSIASQQNRQQLVQERLDSFRDETGEALTNPEMSGLFWFERNRAYDIARERFQAHRAQNPNSALSFPTDEEITAGSIDVARQALGRRRTMEEQASSAASWWGATAGDIGGAVADPVNIAALMFGAGVASGILRTALVEAGVGAASQTAITAGTFGFRRQVDPEFGVGDAFGEVGSAAIAGAVFGGSIKGLSAVWQRARTGYWPRHVRDAAIEVQREASAPSSPFQGAPAEALHRRTIAKSIEDLSAGRPVELPPEVFLKQGARPGRVYDANNRSIGVEYQVVDAADLVTSHGSDLSPNPAFPPELQPRERGRAISQAQILGISANLAPERLGPSPQAESGAPIVGPDGIVESGNARVLALRRAYDQGFAQAESYRNFLKAQGFDTDGMARPVLIARRVTPLTAEERVAFTTAANRATTLSLSAGERALADARLLDDHLLSGLKPGDISSAGNRNFVRGFLEKLPRAEHGAFVDARGQLSQEGARRLEAALVGRAYGDPALLGRALEDTESNVKTIAAALTDGAASWAKMRDAVAGGRVSAGMDITADLIAAVRVVMRARDDGQSVAMLAAHGEMFGGPSETAKMLLRGMFRDGFDKPASRKAVAEMLSSYADEALKNTTEARLFGAPLGAADVMSTALQRAGREDLASQVAERTTPEAAAKLIDAPEVQEATIMQAQRIRAAAPDTMVRLVERDDAGNEITIERRLSEVLDEADDEIEAAREIEACAIGREAAE